MKIIIVSAIALLCCFSGIAQHNEIVKKDKFLDIAGTIGSSQGSLSASYVYNWKFGFGKKRNWEAGIGARITSAFGSNLEYITSGPAKFTRTSTAPFLIVFAGQRPENWDTLRLQQSVVNALNVTANFGYHFNPKLGIGFNIDLIGASFGRKSLAVLLSNGISITEPSAKPSPFNLLLTGDHDRGSLNSEFFVKYKINNKWAIRGVYQFLFTEYTTSNIKQILPDGTSNYRFRNKANNFGVGISYYL